MLLVKAWHLFLVDKKQILGLCNSCYLAWRPISPEFIYWDNSDNDANVDADGDANFADDDGDGDDNA